MSLKNRNFLKLLDYTPAEIEALLDLAADLKAKKKAGIRHDALRGKNIALIFEKTSTRTRCSFEVAAHDLGMEVTYLDPSGSQIGKKESIADTARVLGRMFDGIEYRGYGQQIVEDLAHYAGVPVWNGLTDYDHPTQTLANFLTLKEHFNKPLNELSFAYVGHGQSNMAHALMAGAALAGMDFRIIGPAQFFPEDDFLAKCQKIAEKTGATFTFTDDPVEGVKGLDVIYTGVWVTMGDPYELWGERIKLFMPYRITMDMIKNTGNPDTVFCHCLPAFHNTETKVGKDIYERFGLDGIEVTDDVFEAPFSLAFQEAANRLPTIKAVMVASFAEYPIHE